jgi:8-oxo-dGTP pyrophosphatase MutT (NUDIX family)
MELLENQEETSLHTQKNIEVLEVDKKLYIKQINPGVIILPYTLNENKIPKEIGILSEISETRPGGISKTLITGSPDDDDDNIFQTAVRELKEESGFDVTDLKRWKFLGTLYTSKIVINPNPCFSVNITSLVAEERETDGSKDERDSKFELIGIDEALDLDDGLVSSLFIKAFKELFIKNKTQDETA